MRVIATVKVNVVDANAAIGRRLVGLRWVDEVNALSTTALAVVDGGSARRAVGRLLAGRPVGHVVVELHAAVELDGDIKLADGEAVDVATRAASERGSSAHIRAASTRDDRAIKATKSARTMDVALGEAVLTGEAVEVEAIIVVDRARVQVVPVPSSRLAGTAVVVGVARAAKRRSADEARIAATKTSPGG